MNEALTEAFKALGLTDVARRLTIARAWNEAVGPQIASRTEPDTFRRGTLIVKASSAAWQNELVFLREEIITKVNKALGGDMVKELKIVTGRVHAPVKVEPPPWEKAAPHRDDIAAAKDISSAIADDDVRKTVERVIEKALRVDRHKPRSR
jgi:predicted nucleic acid-binding Zn ribbon protein